MAVAACGTQPAARTPARPAATAVPAPTPTPGRPAPAVVQVENDPAVRPQSGLQKADLVFEYLTEGGITRFSAIYRDPSGSERIGPGRSARLVTLKVLRSFGGVLFYSGASDRVLGMIWDQKLPSLDDHADGGRYITRDGSRPVPHNLFTSGDQLQQGVQRLGTRVTYELPAAAEPAGGDPVSRLSFQQTFSHPVSYAYSEADRAYTYSTDTGPMTDQGRPLKVTNVVLVQVAHHDAGYTEDVRGEEGVDFDLQGSGPADVYSRGGHRAATWDLSRPDQPLRLLGADGAELALPAGLTWIHLVDPGTRPATG